MLPRPKSAVRLAVFFALAALPLLGCSSSQPRDINYGTDAGLGYIPPDGGGTSSTGDAVQIDSGSVDSGNRADAAGDAAIDAASDVGGDLGTDVEAGADSGGSDSGGSDDGSTDTGA